MSAGKVHVQEGDKKPFYTMSVYIPNNIYIISTLPIIPKEKKITKYIRASARFVRGWPVKNGWPAAACRLLIFRIYLYIILNTTINGCITINLDIFGGM